LGPHTQTKQEARPVTTVATDATQRAGAEAALNSAYGVTTARAQVGILENFLASQR